MITRIRMQWSTFFCAFHRITRDPQDRDTLSAGMALVQEFTGATVCGVVRQYNDTLAELFLGPAELPGLFSFSPGGAAVLPAWQYAQGLQPLLTGCHQVYQFPIAHPSFQGALLLGFAGEPLCSTEELELSLQSLSDKVLLFALSRQNQEMRHHIEEGFRSFPQGVIRLDDQDGSLRINKVVCQLLDLPPTETEPSLPVLLDALFKLFDSVDHFYIYQAKLIHVLLDPELEIKDWIWDLHAKVFSINIQRVDTPLFRGRLWTITEVSGMYRTNRRLVRKHKTLRRKNEALAEANREIEGLISVIAHDLKSPLATINAIFHYMMGQERLSPETRENIDYGIKTVRRGVDLINSIVFYNKLLYAEQPLQITEIDLDDLIEALLAGYEVQSRQKGIRLHVQRPETPITLLSDFELLVRILDNLISNAIKFTPLGRNVYVCVYQRMDDYCCIDVRDEGPGILPEERDRLFRRFQRLSARPTNNETSSGLGLSIVKGLADKLGVSVELDTVPDEGSTFRLVFPPSALATVAREGDAPELVPEKAGNEGL